jgi:hypothetical protein
MKRKQEWRTRNKPSDPRYGTHFAVEPHGDKSSLSKAVTVVTPSTSRELEMGTVDVKELPMTRYTEKADKDRVAYFMDLIARGVVFPPADIHRLPDGTWEIQDGKHRIEAYRLSGYKKIPVVKNAISPQAVQLLQKGTKDRLMGMGGGQSQVLRADVEGKVS